MTPGTEREPPGDAELVSAWLGGDQRAADQLVLRHAPALGRFLYASGATRDDVEDLVQEALFRCFRSLEGWRGDGSIRSWLFSIGANLLRDQHRLAKSRPALALVDADAPDPDDPGAEFDATDAAERLRSGLQQLPRLQREVFLRRVQSGDGYNAIAAELGTSAGAARVHYHQAVKRLKELLQ